MHVPDDDLVCICIYRYVYMNKRMFRGRPRSNHTEQIRSNPKYIYNTSYMRVTAHRKIAGSEKDGQLNEKGDIILYIIVK